MKGRDWVLPVVMIVVIMAAVGWFLYSREPEILPSVPAPLVEAPPAQEPPPEAPAETGGGEYTVPKPAAAADAAPLPPLTDSDAPVLASLTELFGDASVEAFLVPTDLIRRFVLMVDLLPQRTMPVNARPVRKIGGPFQTQAGTAAGSVVIDPANAERYSGFVQALQLVDTKALVALYFHYYPLFQSAYGEMGKTVYFNDRLIAVIDHLLMTPVIAQPIDLVPWNAGYRYADPTIEARSVGQKMLIRIGPENAEMIKAKLREVRAALVNRKRDPSAN